MHYAVQCIWIDTVSARALLFVIYIDQFARRLRKKVNIIELKVDQPTKNGQFGLSG